MPYINASIVLQLLSTAFPSLKTLQREEGAQVNPFTACVLSSAQSQYACTVRGQRGLTVEGSTFLKTVSPYISLQATDCKCAFILHAAASCMLSNILRFQCRALLLGWLAVTSRPPYLTMIPCLRLFNATSAPCRLRAHMLCSRRAGLQHAHFAHAWRCANDLQYCAQGRARFQIYQRLLALAFAAVQGSGQLFFLRQYVPDYSTLWFASNVATLMAGAMVLIYVRPKLLVPSAAWPA